MERFVVAPPEDIESPDYQKHRPKPRKRKRRQHPEVFKKKYQPREDKHYRPEKIPFFHLMISAVKLLTIHPLDTTSR